ncbi:MAG: rod shape-determining protein MreC [Deltaproteobacteria bacterium]|nr:rod shape-determining protein MreC [Deltaproteobacteria bacterium]
MVAGLFLFAFLLLQAGLKDAEEQNALDRGLLWASGPLQNAFVWLIDGAAGLWKDYVWLLDVREENDGLKSQVEVLQRELANQKEVLAENERLRELVSMRQTLGAHRVVAARIIGVGTSPISRFIQIDVGSDDGIKPGDAVVASVGLAGRCTSVVAAYSEVQLIIDPRSAVAVTTQRSRARGIVRGMGRDELCKVDHLVRTADVEEGDLLVTSGLGGVYPPGLPVGTVTTTTTPKVGVFRHADMAPVVDFRKIEEVLVILAAGKQRRPRAPSAPGTDGEP